MRAEEWREFLGAATMITLHAGTGRPDKQSVYVNLADLIADLAACERERDELKAGMFAEAYGENVGLRERAERAEAIVDSWNADNKAGPPPTHVQYVGVCEALEKAEDERGEAIKERELLLKGQWATEWVVLRDRAEKAEDERDALNAELAAERATHARVVASWKAEEEGK